MGAAGCHVDVITCSPSPAWVCGCQAPAVTNHRRRCLGRKRFFTATHRLVCTVTCTARTCQLCSHAHGPPSWLAQPPEPSQPQVLVKRKDIGVPEAGMSMSPCDHR